MAFSAFLRIIENKRIMCRKRRTRPNEGNPETGVAVGDVIAAGDSVDIKVTITSNYVYDATLNFAAINLDNVSLKVNFVQAK